MIKFSFRPLPVLQTIMLYYGGSCHWLPDILARKADRWGVLLVLRFLFWATRVVRR